MFENYLKLSIRQKLALYDQKGGKFELDPLVCKNNNYDEN